ncbi:MAG: M20/M25/M40 family metallo-hydrolase [Chloroflexota bacterium]|nr:MAG: M20/M25/M40 family metallo-hydrolase [Chloroflexota bacterium]
MNDLANLYAYIDAHLSDAIADVTRLCRLPTVSARGEALPETAQTVASMLRDLGFSVQLIPTSTGRALVVVGALRGASDFTLLFYNHYDVQPPEPLDLWTSPPFEPEVRDGRLYGRGVNDDKGELCARIAAIRALLNTGRHLPISVKFCIEGEEEIGSPGLDKFVREHKDLLAADACIWEGASVNWHGEPMITLGVKGILYVELEARGPNRDVHSSMATVVPNPAWRLVWALSTLKNQAEEITIEGFYDQVRTPLPLEVSAAHRLPDESGELRQSLGLQQLVLGLSGTEARERDLFAPTCNICGLSAGYEGPGAKTVLPAVARAKLDFRLVPDQRPEDILAKLRRHLDSHGFSDITVIPVDMGENPARTPIDAPFVNIVAQAAREAYGVEPLLTPTMIGSGPMYSFTDFLGLPTASAGIGYPDARIHSPNENLRLSDLAAGIKHLATIVVRLGETGRS